MGRLDVRDPADVLVAGDTVLDLQAGAAAHAGWVMGAVSGAHDRARLLEAPHTHILSSIAEIVGILETKEAPCTTC